MTILIDAPAAVRHDPPALSENATQTILLVDDWGDVRRTITRALENSGYRVLAAADEIEAGALAVRHAEKLSLLIADADLSHASGAEASRLVRLACPDLPVLFISGHPRAAAVRAGLVHADADFLQKPFDWGQLVAAVRSLLDRQG